MITGTFYFNDKPMIVGEILELDITPSTEDEKSLCRIFTQIRENIHLLCGCLMQKQRECVCL